MKKSVLVFILGVLSFCFIAVVVVSFLSVISGREGSTSSEKNLFSKRTKLGIIEISGVIMESKNVVNWVEKLMEDNTIKGVLVRINSPGGAVAPSQEIYDAFKKLAQKKPLYSSMGSLAASGGYYVACGTKKVFADPGTITGSIGVIMQFLDLSKLFQWAKFSPYNIKTGKFKDIGTPERTMTGEEKELLQKMMDNVLGQFRRAISEGRKMAMDKVVEISDGRIFSGEQAKQIGLVDVLGGFQDAVLALNAEVKGEGKPVLVYPPKKQHMILERLFEDSEEDASSSQSSVFFLQKLLGSVLGIAQHGSFLGAMNPESMVWDRSTPAFSGLMYVMPLAIH